MAETAGTRTGFAQRIKSEYRFGAIFPEEIELLRVFTYGDFSWSHIS
jgi:hypothetical protein